MNSTPIDVISGVIRNRIQAEAKHERENDKACNEARAVIRKKLVELAEQPATTREIYELTQALTDLRKQSVETLERLARLLLTKTKPPEESPARTPEQILEEITKGK